MNTAQLRQAHQADHGLRLLVAALHVRPEIGPPGHEADVLLSGEDRSDLGEARRLQEAEAGQTQHQRAPLRSVVRTETFFFRSASSRLIIVPEAERMPPRSFSRYSLIAVPSPPCCGVGTSSVSPKAAVGKDFGPKRGSSPLDL